MPLRRLPSRNLRPQQRRPVMDGTWVDLLLMVAWICGPRFGSDISAII